MINAESGNEAGMAISVSWGAHLMAALVSRFAVPNTSFGRPRSAQTHLRGHVESAEATYFPVESAKYCLSQGQDFGAGTNGWHNAV